MRIAVARVVMVVTVLTWGSAAFADEQKIQLSDVPKAVMDAVKAKFPGAEIRDASKETEDGKTTYEVALTHKGKAVDVSLTQEGKITDIETAITASDLPKAVSSAIELKYPKATLKKVEQIVAVEGTKETTNYEVLLTTEAKKTLEVKISPEGQILKEEASDDDKEAEKK
jgi:hypothetical protein